MGTVVAGEAESADEDDGEVERMEGGGVGGSSLGDESGFSRRMLERGRKGRSGTPRREGWAVREGRSAGEGAAELEEFRDGDDPRVFLHFFLSGGAEEQGASPVAGGEFELEPGECSFGGERG